MLAKKHMWDFYTAAMTTWHHHKHPSGIHFTTDTIKKFVNNPQVDGSEILSKTMSYCLWSNIIHVFQLMANKEMISIPHHHRVYLL